jgi:hypothetical protein
MKVLEGGHKNEARGSGRASGAGVDMLEKDMSEGRQVKAPHGPRSVKFALALHVSERGDGATRLRLRSASLRP